jgi:DNA-binding NtrC family response regulator
MTVTDSTALERCAPHSTIGVVVVVLSGTSRAMTKRVGARLRIGKAPDNDLVLHDATVSRHHCEIFRRADGVLMVQDAGSRNGTRVGGARVREAELNVGTTLSVGGVDLVLKPSVEALEVLPSVHDHFGDVIGRSLAMRTLFGTLEYVAPSQAPVLLFGKSGSGKEVIARAIAKQSPRAKRAFVVVDCGAIAYNLLESELFGHVKGAFTGAHAARSGAFERADRGTVFLDEIGELPLDVQPKFLRILESGAFCKTGSNTSHRVDVRIIAATVRDLAKEVEAGRFREDLYFRLAVVPIRVPSLGERRDDIPLLVNHLLSGRAVSEDALAVLVSADWPGNVRELRNVLERACAIAGPTGRIELAHLGMQLAGY